MKVFEYVGRFGGFDVELSENFVWEELENEDEVKKSISSIAEKLRRILGQIEEYEDYEQLLLYKQYCNKFTDIANDYQKLIADKEYDKSGLCAKTYQEDEPPF